MQEWAGEEDSCGATPWLTRCGWVGVVGHEANTAGPRPRGAERRRRCGDRRAGSAPEQRGEPRPQGASAIWGKGEDHAPHRSGATAAARSKEPRIGPRGPWIGELRRRSPKEQGPRITKWRRHARWRQGCGHEERGTEALVPMRQKPHLTADKDAPGDRAPRNRTGLPLHGEPGGVRGSPDDKRGSPDGPRAPAPWPASRACRTRPA